MSDAERSELHRFVDELIAADDCGQTSESLQLIRVAREVARLRGEIEEQAKALHVAECQTSDEIARQRSVIAKLETGLIEAVELARRVGRRGFITPVEETLAGELLRLVPQ